jgi:hypothetical protein
MKTIVWATPLSTALWASSGSVRFPESEEVILTSGMKGDGVRRKKGTPK